ncbi:hypothetical protein INT46_004270 [Mucor plumbeus]|uniref:Uncharacterized protein n=1 Tax=Mucor plumbeus TaxID=97098 RepID=A0A8H7QKC1_9FUNG|nr:hypothetical protein INT46_004270 [Mucor plumbeus]
MTTHDNRMVSSPTSVSRSQTYQGGVNDKSDFRLFWRQMESNSYKETGYTESSALLKMMKRSRNYHHYNWGDICEKGVIDLTLRKPKAVQKKSASIKKRKRDDSGAAEVPKVNARIGTQSEHFMQFINNVMDTRNEHGTFGRYTQGPCCPRTH